MNPHFINTPTLKPIVVVLAAKNARAARMEAREFAPCTLNGYTENGTCIYISAVREHGNKAPVATATRDGKAVKFVATPR